MYKCDSANDLTNPNEKSRDYKKKDKKEYKYCSEFGPQSLENLPAAYQRIQKLLITPR